jgi:hypothetical protein
MKFPILNRNISDLKILEQYKPQFPNVIFPEGTRFTKGKYRDSCDFAENNGHKISKYAQLPKYKGAFALTKDIVYQMTLVYLDKNHQIIKGEIREFPSVLYIHVKKHTDAPKDETEYKVWLQTQFSKIDDIYDNFQPNNITEMVPNYRKLDYLFYAIYVAVHVGLVYQVLIQQLL